jgi:hypothetical protein
VGDELFGAHGERNRVYLVQQLPGGALMVSWWAGNRVIGAGVFRPDEPVIEYADEVGLR